MCCPNSASVGVHPSMSPKGVEHALDAYKMRIVAQCIHQCRRKALSTYHQREVGAMAIPCNGGSDSNGAKSHVKGRSWDRLASQDLSPSVSQGTIWRYVAVDRRLGYA